MGVERGGGMASTLCDGGKIKSISPTFYSFLSFSLYPSLYIYMYFYTFILILLLLLEFFTPALADGLSLKFEWPQVSSGLRDSSQYSGRSQ